MPCNTHSHSVRHVRNLKRGRDSANLRHMNTQIIDAAIPQQVDPFARIVEQLAHCDGGRGLRPQPIEPFNLLHRHNVFKEEQVIGLRFLRKANCLIRLKTLVYIVEQPNLPAVALVYIAE